jgi:type I restriction enzyme S subunit
MALGQLHTYPVETSVVFRKTNEPFGGLSNMAPGFPLRVTEVTIPTSEALYQACRFPHDPVLQQMIIDQRSPMTAKMKSKPFRSSSRPDWEDVCVDVMRWCLQVKLAQHQLTFGALLATTGERPIVEESRRDRFWGATFDADRGALVGANVLGQLLMELREVLSTKAFDTVEPPGVPGMRLLGKPVERVSADETPTHRDLRLFETPAPGERVQGK